MAYLALRFRAFLSTYLGALDNARQEAATEWLLGGLISNDVQPRMVVCVMESVWVLCKKDNNDGQPLLCLSARATASCVDHLRRALSAGSVLLDKRTALTEVLLRRLYGREARVAVNPELVLCVLGLFVGTPMDKDVLVVLKAL